MQKYTFFPTWKKNMMLDVQKDWLTPTQSLDFVPEWYGPGYGMDKD